MVLYIACNVVRRSSSRNNVCTRRGRGCLNSCFPHLFVLYFKQQSFNRPFRTKRFKTHTPMAENRTINKMNDHSRTVIDICCAYAAACYHYAPWQFEYTQFYTLSLFDFRSSNSRNKRKTTCSRYSDNLC